MCGILAIFGVNSRLTPNVYAAWQQLIPRGPDSSSLTACRDIAILGFTRLSIVDISQGGTQPLVSGDTQLVCNGEIYNHSALVSQFGLEPRTRSDCEAVLRLYKHTNNMEDTLAFLDGVFALALVDPSKQIGYVARDMIGVRPLFWGYTRENDCFAVASEMKSLQHICEIVKPVPPGCFCEVDLKTGKFDRWMRFIPKLDGSNDWSTIGSSTSVEGENVMKEKHLLIDQRKWIRKSAREHPSMKKLRSLLETAVSKRLMTDRPIACLLSGGLDSSIIASILVKLLPFGEPLRTYSIGMEGSTDLHYAKLVAQHLGTQHTEIKFTEEEGIAAIPEVIRAIESYDITTVRASVGMYLLAKYIANNTKDRVIFSGEGSDELLCGYLYFHEAPNESLLQEESMRLLDELYLYDVLRADRCVSSNGLELRVPFLDKNFLEYCSSLNPNVKKPQPKSHVLNALNYPNSENSGLCSKIYEKQFLRHAFDDGSLPSSVIWRRKEGFSDGVSALQNPWWGVVNDFVENLVSDEDLINAENRFPNKPIPETKEAYYYRQLYEQMFNDKGEHIQHYWMPLWTNAPDPSGRLMCAFDETYGF